MEGEGEENLRKLFDLEKREREEYTGRRSHTGGLLQSRFVFGRSGIPPYF